jgi:putative thioredoxin
MFAGRALAGGRREPLRSGSRQCRICHPLPKLDRVGMPVCYHLVAIGSVRAGRLRPRPDVRRRRQIRRFVPPDRNLWPQPIVKAGQSRHFSARTHPPAVLPAQESREQNMSAVFSNETAARPAGDDPVIDTTTQTFAKDVLEESRRRPVLVDFWAPWCGPCKTLSPVIEKAVRAAKGAVRLVKMNIDDHPQIAGQLGIQSIPAVIAFVKGQPVDGFVGALPESQVKAFIARIAGPVGPSDAEALVAEGEALLQAGDSAGAADRFAAALKAEPESVAAVAGLAQALLLTGETDRARQTLDMLPATAAKDPRVLAVRARIDLKAQTAGLGDKGSLEAKIAADLNDYQSRFDLALLLNAEGDREGAVDRLLEIVRKNRSWEDEKARKQLLQFFEAWGPMDAATLAGRRQLSSLLFA